MIFRIRWPFLIMALLLLLGIGAGAYAYLTGYFVLRNINISPDKYSDASKDLNLAPGQNILLASADDAVSYLLSSRPIASVNLQYRLPNAFDIRISDLVATALILAEDRQTLYGVDYKGRLLPLQESDNKYDLPLLTGLKTCPLYQKIPDYRLIQVMNQLERIRQEAPEFYLSLSTIDFTFGDSIMVRAEGLPCGIVMYAGGLYEGMMELKQFLLGFNPDLKMVTKLDFRSKGLIIATKKEVKPSVKAKAPDREKKKNVRSKNNNRH